MILPNRPVVNSNPLSSWLNKAVNNMQSTDIVSNDLNVEQTTTGKRINLRANPFPGIRFSKWDEHFGYSFGDLVYTDTEVVVNSTLISPRAWWICEFPVPVNIDMSQIPIPSDRGEVGDFIRSFNGRNPNLIYRPVIYMANGAEPSKLPSESNDVNEQCRYWRLFSLLPRTMYVCEDNQAVPYFVSGTRMTGSAA